MKRSGRLLFLILFATILYFTEIAYQTSNYTSRLFLTEAIIDHQTLRLDAYQTRLGVDYAVYDNHLYSDKPPGSSVLMLPQYLLLGKPIKWLFTTLNINRTVQGYAVQDVLAGWLVQIFSLGLYSAVSATVLHRILTLLTVTRPFLLTLLTFFGTLLIVYITIGTGEPFTVPPLLLGLYHLLQSRFDPRQNGRYLQAGFWYGLAFFVTNQVLLLIIVAALALLVAARKWPPVARFLLPPLAFALLTLAYNWLLFDHPLHFPQQYWVQGDPQVVLFGLPTPGKLLEMLILPRKGLLFYAPYLLFSIPGLLHLYHRYPAEKPIRQALTLLFGGSFLAYFIFYYFNLGWAGGSDYGFRYMVIVTPFLAIPAALWLDQRPKTPPQKTLARLLILWSLTVCTFGAITDPEVPTGVPNPLLDHNWPLFLETAGSNLPNFLLQHLFNINLWPLRLATTLLFFAALLFIIAKAQKHLNAETQRQSP